jgi:hypothetical protein
MALFNECTQLCARIVLDMADIVREAILRQQSSCPRCGAALLVCERDIGFAHGFSHVPDPS